jgi:hypothetical protein
MNREKWEHVHGREAIPYARTLSDSKAPVGRIYEPLYFHCSFPAPGKLRSSSSTVFEKRESKHATVPILISDQEE